MATSFTVNKADLEFILRQIKIAEATSLGYTPAVAPVSIQQAIMDAYGLSAADAAIAPYGLRTVDGSFNSLVAGQEKFGAADTLFPRLTDPVYRNETAAEAANPDFIDFDGPGPAPATVQANYGQPGTVVDADPRIISNLIVDMSINNPAAIAAYFNNPLSVDQFKADHPGMTPVAPADISTPAKLAAWQAAHPGEAPLALTNTDLQSIPNQSPDIGLSPGFNSWMTFFGQFFDHGLDLVTKGNNGTVYVPLQADDPLVAGADGIFGNGDDLAPHLRFMALTRANPTLVDPDGAGPLPAAPQHENTTTSFVDQNQTYTSNASHQVFLREYDTVGGKTVSTGRLLDGTVASGSVAGAIGNWAEVKAQALTLLGINLSDLDVLNVPLLLTDQYGKFIPGPNGYAQLVMAPDAQHATNWLKEGNPDGSVTTAGSIGTNHAFLNDIAHHATPGFVDTNHNGVKDPTEAFQVADTDPGVGDDNNPNTYDDEMLNAHFITGDGRGNENIALTSVHSIFHSEHNRLVDVNKATILASGDVAFLNEWLIVDQATTLTAAQVQALNPNALEWDGERLFQAARFGTEMQYQHLVFEEFARRIQPMVDPFIFNSSPDVDPSIVAEFAHTVYRYGHSMLTGTVDRLDNNLDPLNPSDPNSIDGQQTLLAVFLNPAAYLGSGATLEEINANLIRGLSRDVGNAIDEFIVTDVRSNLLGLPLDLAALNLARGRETGIPSLNQTREQLYNDTGLADLKPYESWANFAQNIKNPTSVINFIAAYGTHSSITSQTTLADRRAAAEELVFGVDGPDANTSVASDRLDFLNARNAYAADRGGLDLVDLWIGGLAEKSPEFGGMLGTTFNYVFEAQMENLQNGDRLYYLTRTQGLNFLNNLEPNTFSDLVMRNTDLGGKYSTHLNGALFTTPDYIIELDRGIAQEDYNGAGAGNDPLWDGSNPVVEAILGPKVVRDYAGGTVADGNHDVGGYLRVLGGEHYVLGGTEGNDRIYGDSGIDTLWGDGGNDYLNGMTESDDVFGGEGDDIIEDPFGDDVLRGNQGNDVITSSRGADLLFGDQGQDYILVGQDASEVFAGTGNDFVLGGNGKDFLLGNEGDDWIEGGGGFDTIAGDNSELFFNSPIIGHDVLFGHGDETDYDSESGDDIMGSGPSVYRYEGMFGFDWGIAKFDNSAIKFDLQIPIFTTIPEDVLRDRFDQVEALSGWKNGDVLDGDDRGHSGGSSSPDSTPVELFTDHTLDNAGVDRITGLRHLLGLDGVANASFKNGNVLIGGDGNDMLRGRGGFDTIDGDAWLNVRIKIVIPTGTVNSAGQPVPAGIYSAESMTTDTAVAGEFAGKVYNVNPDGSPNFNSPAFGGESLSSLMLNRTINPGQLSIVREILYDNTDATGPNKNIDTAVFQGGDLEYEIEGTRIVYDAATGEALRRVNVGQGDNSTQPLNIRDVNGDGFITVRDLDDGLVAAPGRAGGLTVSRGALTDDTDKLVNIERLQFADKTLTVGATATNSLATGTVTIFDPSPFDHDGNPATAGVVSPIVGQVLTATLSNLVDLDGVPLDANGNPVGLTFEWQTTEAGNDGGWATISSGLTYTVRPVDPAHVLRAVAVFKDSKGVTERIASTQTDNVTAPFSINENSISGTVVSPTIPFSLDYDPLGFGGTGVTDGDVVQLTHVMSPGQDAGGRFAIVNGQIVVANGGPVMLNYEAGVHTTANQSHQFVDNQYQIVIDTYTDTIANGGVLMAQRQFTIFLNDVTGEVADIVPTVDLHADATVTTPTTFAQAYRDQFDAAAYNNSNGTTNWTTSWSETGDNGSATTGEISISVDGLLRFNAGADNNDAITRAVNGLPADVTAATLSFNYQSVGLDTGNVLFGDREHIMVEARNSTTGAWTEIGDLSGNTNSTFSAAIPVALLGANTQIRFRVETDTLIGGNSVLEAGESFSIDNVNIALTRNVVSTVSGAPGNNYTAVPYTEGGAAVAVASNPSIGNEVSSIMSATIKLTNAQAADALTFAGALPAGISMSFGPAVAGEVTMFLTGNASLAAYQTAIQAVRFANTADNPLPTPTASPRLIEVTVNDGVNTSTVATATIAVNAVNDAPIGGNDAIITNSALGTGFVVPEWALLANDTDPDSAVLDITAVGGVNGLNVSLGAGSLSIADTGPANGSLTYTVSDGAATDATPPVVSVTTVASQTTTTYTEAFATTSYTDNDGGWTENWSESGDDGSSTGVNGQIRINGGQLQFDAGNSAGASNGAVIQRAINLAGATSATISYAYTENIDPGESVTVDFSRDGVTFETVQTITSASNSGSINNQSLTGPFTGNALLRFTVSTMNIDADLVTIDNINIAFTTPAPVNGTNNSEILVGDINGSTFDAGTGNDLVFAGDGNDTIVWNANNGDPTDGRDFVDGGAGLDTFDLNTRTGTNESFRVYTVAEALSGPNAIVGLTAANLKPGTEIIITRTTGGGVVNVASIIAELDNIEEIRIGTQTADPTPGSAGPGDTVAIFGDFSTTSLALNTITIDGNAGDDTIDISALSSAHRIVFRSNGGNDTIIGTMRPQDVIELPAGAVAANYTTTTDADGVSTMTDGTHSITFSSPSGMPQVGTDDDEDDDDTAGNDDDNDNDDDRACDDDDTDTTGNSQKTGTPVADVLIGSEGDDNIVAFAGDDIVNGNAGADAISAGEGADFISGGDGRDVIFAGAGDDQVFAGGQADIVYGDAGADRIFGDGGNDLITAGAGDDAVFGGAGNDLIVAEIGDGNDVYFGDDSDGGTGVDTLDVSAATANVTVNLGSGSLSNGTASSSQTGNDTIWGIENVNTGSGNDTIIASGAVNVMNGGAGNDTFKFLSASSADGDTIVGFEAGDRVDLTAIDANVGNAGDQSFTLVSSATFTAAGQLAVTFESRADGDFTVVQGNIDGNADADFKIEISGHQNLTNANLGL